MAAVDLFCSSRATSLCRVSSSRFFSCALRSVPVRLGLHPLPLRRRLGLLLPQLLLLLAQLLGLPAAGRNPGAQVLVLLLVVGNLAPASPPDSPLICAHQPGELPDACLRRRPARPSSAEASISQHVPAALHSPSSPPAACSCARIMSFCRSRSCASSAVSALAPAGRDGPSRRARRPGAGSAAAAPAPRRRCSRPPRRTAPRAAAARPPAGEPRPPPRGGCLCAVCQLKADPRGRRLRLGQLLL